MSGSTGNRRLTRRGVVLPLVMVGMLLLLVMSVALQQAAWRSARGARTLWDTQTGLYAADAATIQAMATWNPDSMAATPIGVPQERIDPAPYGWWTHTALVRTGTLTAVIRSTTHRDRASAAVASAAVAGMLGDGTRIQRTVVRAIRLEPPSVPVLAALTVLGDLEINAGTVDGRDQFAPYDPARDDCGSLRDSASIAAIAAEGFSWRTPGTLFGLTFSLTPPSMAIARAQFDSGFAAIAGRTRTFAMAAPGSVPGSSPWRASVIQVTPGVTIDGVSDYVGLLAVDGDLIVRGTLRVEGMLLVRGAVDVSSGALDVRGALVVRDRAAIGSRVGATLRVAYAPCLVGRALVAVAQPSRRPFGVWNSP
ncbi:MAG: hypothetical protein IPP90_05875 [Gemmatimonadaceae bacterium]|nr:hypothetical protein [Gemmatimonadaceae bacterium]